MTTTPKRSSSRAHKVSWIALALAVLGVLSQILNIFTPTPTPTTQQIAKVAAPVAQKQAAATLKKAAVRFVNSAANAPQPANQTCTVPVGQGKPGYCAPSTALPRSLVGAVTAAASSIPHVHGLIGVDTSSYQNCQRAPAWLSFWIVKATEGTGYRDRCTATNVAQAKQQHQVCGVYDFMRATGSYAGAESSAFVRYIRQTGATRCIHVIDVETGSLQAATIHSYVCSWVDAVKRAFPGQPVVIYTGVWFWGPRVGGSPCGAVLWDSAYASYAVLPGSWGGGYLTTSGYTLSLSQGGHYRASTPLWQYGDGRYGPSPRVNGWDTDVFFGNRTQLERLAGIKPAPCSKRTACKMGRRHHRVHQAIVRDCHPPKRARQHVAECRRLHNRNRYMHGYARRHRLTLVTK